MFSNNNNFSTFINEPNWEYLCNQLRINKHALPIFITKAREVQFSILFLQMFRCRFANATQVLMCKYNNQKLENMEKAMNQITSTYPPFQLHIEKPMIAPKLQLRKRKHSTRLMGLKLTPFSLHPLLVGHVLRVQLKQRNNCEHGSNCHRCANDCVERKCLVFISLPQQQCTPRTTNEVGSYLAS